MALRPRLSTGLPFSEVLFSFAGFVSGLIHLSTGCARPDGPQRNLLFRPGPDPGSRLRALSVSKPAADTEIEMRLLPSKRPAVHDSQSAIRPRAERIAPNRSTGLPNERRASRRGGVAVTFRLRLDAMLDRPSRSEIDLAGSIIAARLRKEDGFELRDDSEFTVVLAKTDPQAARVVAARLASEISFRSVAFRKRNWVAEFVD